MTQATWPWDGGTTCDEQQTDGQPTQDAIETQRQRDIRMKIAGIRLSRDTMIDSFLDRPSPVDLEAVGFLVMESRRQERVWEEEYTKGVME